jgi:hypothetical protein
LSSETPINSHWQNNKYFKKLITKKKEKKEEEKIPHSTAKH